MCVCAFVWVKWDTDHVCVCMFVIIKSACEFDYNFDFDYFPIRSDGQVFNSVSSFHCLFVFVIVVINRNINLYFQFGAMLYIYTDENQTRIKQIIYIWINVMVWQRFSVTVYDCLYFGFIFVIMLVDTQTKWKEKI